MELAIKVIAGAVIGGGVGLLMGRARSCASGACGSRRAGRVYGIVSVVAWAAIGAAMAWYAVGGAR